MPNIMQHNGSIVIIESRGVRICDVSKISDSALLYLEEEDNHYHIGSVTTASDKVLQQMIENPRKYSVTPQYHWLGVT